MAEYLVKSAIFLLFIESYYKKMINQNKVAKHKIKIKQLIRMAGNID